MTECGFCGHPGVHAQVLPPRGAAQGRCSECPRCQQEIAEEAAKAAKQAEREKGPAQ
jgi:hypothetical protein